MSVVLFVVLPISGSISMSISMIQVLAFIPVDMFVPMDVGASLGPIVGSVLASAIQVPCKSSRRKRKAMAAVLGVTRSISVRLL
jgi:hypothetical protein